MKKLLHIALLTVLIIVVSLYGKLIINQYILQQNTPKKSTKSIQKVEQASSTNIAKFLGENSENLLAQFGEPARIDPSAYDYEWWVYNQDLNHYVQFGIQNEKIVTIYVGGQNVDISPFHIGESYTDVSKQASFSSELSVGRSKNSYQFELSEQDVRQDPLISVENGWSQLYFDTFTKELVGIRYLDDDTLLKERPYQLIYTGALIQPTQISGEQLQKIEQGNAKQILDTTNIIRLRHNLPLLKWDDQTSQVAYLHSKDMHDQNYFSHDSPRYGSLGDRLHQGNVTFRLAGENIASNYPDGVAAVQGWLNSEGHRKNLLDGEFTAIGIGVNDKYYTQDFILK
ncbi:CAP domain-containing protein [Ectobacillus polymachus]|uniref:CAP domain-containing protein n=1 Tax=Ectobacillus polymachus TaxID=1508806 RepID=UPI003A8A48A4